MKHLIHGSLFAAALFFNNAAFSQTIDHSRFARPEPGRVRAVKPDATVVYNGFYIKTMPDAAWGIVPGKQQGQRAFWAIIDQKNILHTKLATVVLSPQLPPKHLKSLTLEKLKLQLEAHYNKNSNRLNDLKVSSRYTVVNGIKFVEINSSAWDTGSKYATDQKLQLHARLLTTITPDGRIMTITVSERIPGETGTPDCAAFDAFVQAVHPGRPE